MIIILTNKEDVSSDIVEEYMIQDKIDYCRINAEDIIYNPFDFEVGNNHITIANKKIYVENVNVVWYRKFGNLKEFEIYKQIRREYGNNITEQLINEHYEIMHSIVDLFMQCKWLTHPHTLLLSKISVLKKASKIGFNIPKTIITNKKNSLKKIGTDKNGMIVKSVYEALFYEFKNYSFSMFTTQIDEDDLTNIPQHFFPSLIQRKIDKDIEIRVFYLDGKCYSMAIFSQGDTLTKEDYRLYNWENPIRFVPYIIEQEVADKIKKLCNEINLNCCSIDLIKDKRGKYFFLEVNQVGEFGMVSSPCDYNLHYEVFKTLLKYN